MRPVVIIGAGSQARETLEILDACRGADPRSGQVVLGFIVDEEYRAQGSQLGEKPILGGFEWLEQNAARIDVICAIGAPHLRYRLAQRAKSMGAQFCSAIHPTAVISRSATFGSGCIIAAQAVLSCHVVLGEHVLVNLACTVSHDSVLQDFVSAAPGVHIAGRVSVGTGCLLGIGSAVTPDRRIGEWSLVGAGSAVTADLPDNCTAVGVPARVIKRRPADWHLTAS
ncbi:MAG TPA: acetyltransferase [Thermoflexales bacterium]|nr:acetyltransferase [Thermoflexales bacterium]